MILTILCTSGLLPEESFTDCKLVARRPPDLLSDTQLQKEQGKKPPQDEYTSVRVKKLKRGSSPETNKLIDYLVRRVLCFSTKTSDIRAHVRARASSV